MVDLMKQQNNWKHTSRVSPWMLVILQFLSLTPHFIAVRSLMAGSGPLNTNSYAKNLSHHESTHQQSLGPFRLHEADEVLSQK